MSNHIESQAEKQPEIQTGSPSVERCLVFESGALSLFMSTNYVIEIINGHSITPIPMIPSFIKGILNLRGQILPVVDIRLYMGHEEMEFTRQTCIIVVQVDSLSLGIIVDSEQQVIDIDLANVRSIPVKRQQKLLDGMVTLEDGRVLMSCDCKALINDPG